MIEAMSLLHTSLKDLSKTYEENMIDKIKGTIFDMDGTLIDSFMIWDVLWEKFGERYKNGDSLVKLIN